MVDVATDSPNAPEPERGRGVGAKTGLVVAKPVQAPPGLRSAKPATSNRLRKLALTTVLYMT